MSSPEREEIKPDVAQSPTKKRKIKVDEEDAFSLPNSPTKKGKANSSAATKSSGAKPKGRQTAPAITPENCDPPLKGARDPRLTVAYLEKLIDESGPEGRKEIALAFGIKPADYGQAWADTMKFRVKNVIRSGLLGNATG